MKITHTVMAEDTARAVGSGDVDVLSTPILLAWCEEATCAALQLDPSQTSVGVSVSLEHLAPSPVGESVTARADVVERDDRRVRFFVSAVDGQGTVVASGEIVRAIVDRERFLSRVKRM